jgi:hypothetical protein
MPLADERAARHRPRGRGGGGAAARGAQRQPGRGASAARQAGSRGAAAAAGGAASAGGRAAGEKALAACSRIAAAPCQGDTARLAGQPSPRAPPHGPHGPSWPSWPLLTRLLPRCLPLLSQAESSEAEVLRLRNAVDAARQALIESQDRMADVRDELPTGLGGAGGWVGGSGDVWGAQADGPGTWRGIGASAGWGCPCLLERGAGLELECVCGVLRGAGGAGCWRWRRRRAGWPSCAPRGRSPSLCKGRSRRAGSWRGVRRALASWAPRWVRGRPRVEGSYMAHSPARGGGGCWRCAPLCSSCGWGAPAAPPRPPCPPGPAGVSGLGGRQRCRCRRWGRGGRTAPVRGSTRLCTVCRPGQGLPRLGPHTPAGACLLPSALSSRHASQPPSVLRAAARGHPRCGRLRLPRGQELPPHRCVTYSPLCLLQLEWHERSFPYAPAASPPDTLRPKRSQR